VTLPGVRQAVKVNSQRTEKKTGKTSEEDRHYMSSLTRREGTEQRMGEAIRSHWSVENPNHWRRDSCWGEDKCRLRNPNAACAVALLRTTLLLPALRSGRGSLPEVFEQVQADPDFGIRLLTRKSFP